MTVTFEGTGLGLNSTQLPVCVRPTTNHFKSPNSGLCLRIEDTGAYFFELG